MFTYKLILLGESSVGKTSFLGRYVKKNFSEKVESTVGANLETIQEINLSDRKINLEILDTCGQVREIHSNFRRLTIPL